MKKIYTYNELRPLALIAKVADNKTAIGIWIAKQGYSKRYIRAGKNVSMGYIKENV